MGQDRVLDLGGGQVLPTAAQHLLAACDEGVGAVAVHGHQVAGVEPAVDDGGSGLLRHLPVPGRDRGVAQQQLTGLTGAHVPAVLVDHAGRVDRAEPRVLPGGAEGPERARAMSPDQAVGRLRHAVAAHDSQAEALLEGLLPGAGGGGAGVAQPQRGVGVVRAHRLAPQDLQHRTDGVELRRPVPPRAVQEAAGREPGQQHQTGTAGQRPQHRVGGRVDVEQRQRGHQPVVARELQPVGEAFAGHGVGTVRLHDQLRASGCPRCRDEHGEVVGSDGDRDGRPDRSGAPPVPGQLVDVEGHGPGVAKRREGLGEPRPDAHVGDDHARPHLAEEPGELTRGRGRVGGHGDGTEAGQRQPAQQVWRGARGGEDHEVPPAGPCVEELPGEPGHLGGRSAEGERAVVGAQPGALGVALRGGHQQLRDGVSHARPRPLRRLPPVSGGRRSTVNGARRPDRSGERHGVTASVTPGGCPQPRCLPRRKPC